MAKRDSFRSRIKVISGIASAEFTVKYHPEDGIKLDLAQFLGDCDVMPATTLFAVAKSIETLIGDVNDPDDEIYKSMQDAICKAARYCRELEKKLTP